MSGSGLIAMRGDEVLVDAHRLFGVRVDSAHEPAGIVRADRNHHQIERAAARADGAELRVVGGVAGEEDAHAACVERETAPERPVPVEQARGR